jgi:hypothetical protein
MVLKGGRGVEERRKARKSAEVPNYKMLISNNYKVGEKTTRNVQSILMRITLTEALLYFPEVSYHWRNFTASSIHENV